ncbi:hypothetical protein PVAG01_06295 [Phlyctema vagabunda]|uniref:Uncharacterized protein n=1 Tax=Phlyctema vagabunda TaxID=108571 RepID=A0ABR4PFQ2_9HELO
MTPIKSVVIITKPECSLVFWRTQTKTSCLYKAVLVVRVK